MKYGHFDDAAREYVITRPDTPRAWSNYLGSRRYGAIITNNAGGYSFTRSPASGRFLRHRYNSVPMDLPGRQFYLRDRDSGDFWSAAWQPVGKPLDEYRTTTRFGLGYAVITSEWRGIRSEAAPAERVLLLRIHHRVEPAAGPAQPSVRPVHFRRGLEGRLHPRLLLPPPAGRSRQFLQLGPVALVVDDPAGR
jgi:cellobiose phosphorylase